MITCLSQTAINDFERCEYRFKKMWAENWKKGAASLPMSVGSCFDAYCRCHLNRQLKLDVELIDRNGAIPSDEAVEMGRLLYRAYVKSGAMAALEKEGVAVVCASKEVILNGVPFAGMPDLIMHNGAVYDWKTSGVSSKNGATPKSGYVGGWRFNGAVWVPMGQHAKAGRPMEEIDPKWARQLTLYSFLMGKRPPHADLKVGVDAVFVNGGEICICQYRATVSLQFQMDEWHNLPRVWNTVQTDQYAIPTFGQYKCNMWGRTCELAEQCPAFQNAMRPVDPDDWMSHMRYGGKR